MRKIQKAVLVFYVFAICILSYIYVPFVCHLEDGLSRYIGHHLRGTIAKLFSQKGSKIYGFCTIDSSLILVEFLSFTAITVAVLLILKQKEKS